MTKQSLQAKEELACEQAAVASAPHDTPRWPACVADSLGEQCSTAVARWLRGRPDSIAPVAQLIMRTFLVQTALLLTLPLTPAATDGADTAVNQSRPVWSGVTSQDLCVRVAACPRLFWGGRIS